VMAGVAVIVLPIFYTSRAVSRWEGLLLIVLYASFALSLILDATGDPGLPRFTWVMTRIVIPVIAVGLAVRVAQQARSGSEHR